MMYHHRCISSICIVALLCLNYLFAQDPSYNNNKFRQLYDELPTPNTYRTASGAPGHQYWQQQADYKIHMTLDDVNEVLHGEETITYTNNSPDALDYLWLQLDQNIREQNSAAILTRTGKLSGDIDKRALQQLLWDFDGGFKITEVSNSSKQAMDHTIVGTMMRIDLSEPLTKGKSITFNINWHYNINNTRIYGGRSGYEPFSDGNNVYCIAQFYPRMCVYNDNEGWQNKQFIGNGEFALTFGDYDVKITVPEDHLVASTGELQNSSTVLSKEQQNALQEASKTFDQPVIIVNEETALSKSKKTARDIEKTKTWHFTAEEVRDFAFATSRRFIWDAMNTELPNGETAMAMSMYVTEGKPLWEKYSTKAVAHTLKWYSHYTIDYPYPVAWSIDGSMGMEYPMICFNYGRCADDGTYSKRIKYGHIGVIIHEVGHNFFPMIINSDERQWTWMDEGLNTFTQFLTEQQWERDFPSRRGQPYKIVDYMKGNKDNIMPIMTNSESIHQFGNNAYGKPATALNILRETILGRELFDYAFKTYSERWAFKHPTPADFFRTMEDASGIDLDWFWRGWFYTNDHVDIALDNVQHINLNPATYDKLLSEKEEIYSIQDRDITTIRNKEEIKQTYSEEDPTLLDFYNKHSQATLDLLGTNAPKASVAAAQEEDLYKKTQHLYELTFSNIGGLVMPVIVQFNYSDGTDETITIPAEIWRKNDKTVSKVFPLKKEVKSVVLDPYLQTADTDLSNNHYPPRPQQSRFQIFQNNTVQKNEMQLYKEKN